jgi:hypothetical protein
MIWSWYPRAADRLLSREDHEARMWWTSRLVDSRNWRNFFLVLRCDYDVPLRHILCFGLVTCCSVLGVIRGVVFGLERHDHVVG